MFKCGYTEYNIKMLPLCHRRLCEELMERERAVLQMAVESQSSQSVSFRDRNFRADIKWDLKVKNKTFHLFSYDIEVFLQQMFLFNLYNKLMIPIVK